VVVTLDLAPYPGSVREARRFTVDTLRSWGLEDLSSAAALLVTELVTNSVLHARTVMQVCLSRLENSVRLEVRDKSPVRPTLRSHAIDATTGRGLNLVAKLAHSWGVEVEGAGKSVWAELSSEAGSGWPDEAVGEPAGGPDPTPGRPGRSAGAAEARHRHDVDLVLRWCA
jgi:anti-sigma regulatory factor (Ser/Thr protein kinase)